MKTSIALLALAITAHAGPIAAPNGLASIQTDGSIQLVSNGQPILTIVQSTAGDRKIHVAWSPDSRRVVIVENTARGSGIVAAFEDGTTWRKTLELDTDASELIRQAQGNIGGRLVSESRSLAGWISQTEIEVTGELVFTKGKVSYSYLLQLKPGTGKLDAGGFAEGLLVGRDYRVSY